MKSKQKSTKTGKFLKRLRKNYGDTPTKRTKSYKKGRTEALPQRAERTLFL
jgi:hypothetical protein